LQVQGVARARCLAPGAQPGKPGEPRPGQVQVVVLADGGMDGGYVPPDRLTLSAELRAGVQSYLDERRTVGTQLEVVQPLLTWVVVEANIRVPERSDPGLVAEVERNATAVLYRYLNPFTGGPQGTGWPFGRDLHTSEIVGVLQRIPGVEFVEEVRIGLTEPGSAAAPRPAPARLAMPPQALVCSGRHHVTVT
jgi:predicted phage baseplate assembly protein